MADFSEVWSVFKKGKKDGLAYREAAGLARMKLTYTLNRDDLKSIDDKEEYDELYNELSKYMEGRDKKGKKLEGYYKEINPNELKKIIQRTENLVTSNEE